MVIPAPLHWFVGGRPSVKTVRRNEKRASERGRRRKRKENQKSSSSHRHPATAGGTSHELSDGWDYFVSPSPSLSPSRAHVGVEYWYWFGVCG
jgi:hypothetical protein